MAGVLGWSNDRAGVRRRGIRQCLLLVLFCLGILSSPAVSAALCSNVFPQNATPGASERLDLSVMKGQRYVAFPSNGTAYTTSGDFFYQSGKLAKDKEISVTPGQPVRIFVEGDLEFAQDSRINPGGSAADLLIVVRGNLKIQKTVVNALLYVTGNADVYPDSSIKGALTAEGSINTVGGDVRISYDDEAAEQFAYSDLCAAIDHFEFVTSAGAHTCSPHTVTLKACTNDAPDECQLYPGDVSVSLTSNGWVGGSNKTLINGIGTFHLQGLQLEMPLGVAASSPLPGNQTLCQIGGAPSSAECTLSFSQSGFIFDVPNMLANMGAQNIPISAVVDLGTPGSPNCEPAFIDESREVKFWSGFVSPAGSELTVNSELVWVNGNAIAQNFTEAEALPLRFDNKGKAFLEVNYREAGKMQLNAFYAGSNVEDDSGLMVGSDDFVATPAGFCITPESTCLSGDKNCPAFRQVGRPFSSPSC